MALTDVQIYELRPDIKTLNDEYVSLGTRQKELDGEVSAAHDALAVAEESARQRVAAAQVEVQKAQAALNLAMAEESTKVKTSRRVLEAKQHELRVVIDRRAKVQHDHNDACNDVQKEQAAKDLMPTTE